MSGRLDETYSVGVVAQGWVSSRQLCAGLFIQPRAAFGELGPLETLWLHIPADELPVQPCSSSGLRETSGRRCTRQQQPEPQDTTRGAHVYNEADQLHSERQTLRPELAPHAPPPVSKRLFNHGPSTAPLDWSATE